MIPSENHAFDVWTAMSDTADAYDAANVDLLEGASFEILLALVQAGAALSHERHVGLLGVGALLLRLSCNAGADRAASTARMMKRLGLPIDDQFSPETN
ncbi:hypothetical protein ASE82_09445 [Sphingomonas sp. Leaf230]|uniref:hypothetical protein n=1 Tax=Sphingomonas sp. Leaf230 TaxID=1735694 RepID=UPI0006F3E481|nr:hypothetical protein [Sphingomonas sp. Leaf230]KQN02550.1 hypothetical protein ASE82_09445 [Sphingomonas sp. Leaf230]